MCKPRCGSAQLWKVHDLVVHLVEEVCGVVSGSKVDQVVNGVDVVRKTGARARRATRSRGSRSEGWNTF